MTDRIIKAGMDNAAHGAALARAALIRTAELQERGEAAWFRFDFACIGPREADRQHYIALRDRRRELALARAPMREIIAVGRDLDAIELEAKWQDEFRNLVTTGGKNDALDKYFAGSGYTAAWYLLLIGSTGYSALNAADTMASHAGWTESVAYSNASRPTLAFAAASGGSKATSAAASFTINATDTIKGAATTTVNTKSGTTGILYSAGLFTGGDRAVANGDTLQVSGSWSL